MVTVLSIWWPNHYAGDFYKVKNRSPTSQTCHRHISSPTSITNIDRLDFIKSIIFLPIKNLLKENEYLQKQNEKLFSDNADLNQDSQLTKEYVLVDYS